MAMIYFSSIPTAKTNRAVEEKRAQTVHSAKNNVTRVAVALSMLDIGEAFPGMRLYRRVRNSDLRMQ